jgi:hypothetical protein
MEFDSIKQKLIVLTECKTAFDWSGSNLHNSRTVGKLISHTRDFIPIRRNQSGKAENTRNIYIKVGHFERSKFRTWQLHKAVIIFPSQDTCDQTKLTVKGEVHKA